MSQNLLPYDRHELEDQEKIKALDQLFQDVYKYRDSQEFLQLLEFIKKFPSIAPYNAFLPYIQRPGCRYVTTAKRWKEMYGRYVKKEARPLVILRNFGPVDFVFDVSDTEGNKLPDEVENPFKVKSGILDEKYYYYLQNNLERYGIHLHLINFGSQYAGCIKKIDPIEKIIHTEKYIYTINFNYHIEINKNLNIEERFVTIVHELGHLFCGHLGTPSNKLWPQRKGLDINTREFEAESVAWLVSERLGIKNPSDEYLRGYLTHNNEIPSISLEIVFRAVNMIERMINQTIPIEKELIAKKEKKEKTKNPFSQRILQMRS